MQYRTFKLQQLAAPYTWDYTKADGTTATFYNYDTLVYASGGAVSSYSLDNDYMVNNNSTVYLAKETKAVAGQIIALIDDSGAYDLGIVTNVDNEKLQILYKPMLELFNNDFLNPARDNTSDDTEITYKYDGIIQTGQIVGSYYCTTVTDRYLRLPLFIRNSGGGATGGQYNVPAVWTYKDSTFNIKDWLIDLFDTHNVVLQFKLVFEAGERAYIEVFISRNANGNSRLLKANIHGMTVSQTEESEVKATVCQVIDQDTKALKSTWYLTVDNTITSSASHSRRMQPFKLTVAEWDSANAEGVTAEDVAKDALLYSDYNHYINIKISQSSQMKPQNLQIGDAVVIVPEIEEMKAGQSIETDYTDKVFKSVYTGKKESSASNEITLIFGKIRVNYTDIIQMKNMKKIRS